MFSSKPEAVIWFYTQPRWSEVHNDDNCYFLSEVVVDKENKKEVSVSNNNNNWNKTKTQKEQSYKQRRREVSEQTARRIKNRDARPNSPNENNQKGSKRKPATQVIPRWSAIQVVWS